MQHKIIKQTEIDCNNMDLECNITNRVIENAIKWNITYISTCVNDLNIIIITAIFVMVDGLDSRLVFWEKPPCEKPNNNR